MHSRFDMATLRSAVEAGRVYWHRHALERILERNISLTAVIEEISKGEVIDVYRTDRPHLSALILYRGAEPMHVVAAADPSANVCHVITAYEPDLARFEPDFRTRRKER